MAVSSCCCWAIRLSSCECDVLKSQIEATFQEIHLEDRFKYIDDSNIVLMLGILYLCLI